MTTITTGQQIFEELLGDISYTKESDAGQLYPFFVRVGCVKRRPPRHPFFEYILDMGRMDIDKICKKEPIEKSYLTFVFPERWLGVAEQQAFTHLIKENPSVDKIANVDIISSSPLIIGSFFATQIRILTWPEDSGKFDGQAYPT